MSACTHRLFFSSPVIRLTSLRARKLAGAGHDCELESYLELAWPQDQVKFQIKTHWARRRCVNRFRHFTPLHATWSGMKWHEVACSRWDTPLEVACATWSGIHHLKWHEVACSRCDTPLEVAWSGMLTVGHYDYDYDYDDAYYYYYCYHYYYYLLLLLLPLPLLPLPLPLLLLLKLAKVSHKSAMQESRPYNLFTNFQFSTYFFFKIF